MSSEEKLKAYTFQLPEGPVVVKFVTPIPEEVYDRFEDERRRSESAASTRLVKSCVRSHTGSQLDEVFSRFPALKHALSLTIQKEAGGYLAIVEGEPQPS